jgi:tight adherence protein B
MTILQVVILFFIAAQLLVIAGYLWYSAIKSSPRFELRKRLRRLAVDPSDRRFPEELRVEILQEMTPTDKLLLRLRPLKRLDLLIDKAGIKSDVKMFLLFMLVTASFGFAGGLLIQRGMSIAVAIAIVGAIVPILYLLYRKQRRIKHFTEQFPEVLELITRSLRAGHSFASAVKLVSTEMAEPCAGLFKNVYDEQALGVSMRDALDHMTNRIESIDLNFFVMAISVHREVGGNLGEILDRLAKTIRERLTVRRQVKVYTAQARLSGYILAVVPLFMAFFFYVASPGYIEELFKVDVGIYAIVGAVIAQALGFLIIRRIINIRI